MSKAEREFRKEFPHTRVEIEVSHFGKRYKVFAGDYLCDESYGRKLAFSRALLYYRAGYITPDSGEKSSAALTDSWVGCTL